MFERYTEKARRVIFFARREASEVGSPAIETEHLLLALFHDKGILQPYLDERASEVEIRATLAKSVVSRAPSSTSVDLPLSSESRYILHFSAEEAERLGHKHIGTEHLVAGILREENCLAARLLRDRGLTLERARTVLAPTVTQAVPGGRLGSGSPSARWIPSIPTTIDVIDAETSEMLFSYEHCFLIPRMGETILFHKEGSPDRAYKVSDVVWDFKASLQNVIVSVHKGTDQGARPSGSTAHQRPILSVTMDVKTDEEHQQLQKILGELTGQDPTLSIGSVEGSTRTTLQGMDEWYLEQICERIVRDHKIKIDLGEIEVIYLETIRKSAEAEGKYIRQTGGGAGNYGHVKIRVEPDKADFVFVTDIQGGVVPQEYFQPIEQGVREALRGGVLAGHEIVNVKATLFDGSYHDVDSNAMAFQIAGSMALKDAARKASPVLLEPMMAVEAVMPEELVGSTLADITSRRGRIESVEQRGHSQVAHAIVPLAEMLGPSRPAWSMRFAGYEQGPPPGGWGDSSVGVAQPKRPTMGRGAVRPEKDFEG